VSRLSKKPMNGKVVAVLRSCEIRAFIELVKLKQGNMDNLILLGIDCLGAYNNIDYSNYSAGDAGAQTNKYYESVLSGKGTAIGGVDLASACQICDQPVPGLVDISVALYGVDWEKEFIAQSGTDKGAELLNSLDLKDTEEPARRKDVVEVIVAARKEGLEKVLNVTAEAVGSIEKLNAYLASCVNCYNCRVACPVCYCKECVFVTDVFDHEPTQYLNWSARKGEIKMPTDTVFFHITRIAHMSLSCVGCGQCSNACPNNIPLAEIFRYLSQDTQESFDYLAGRSLEEAPPLSLFNVDEYQDVVGVSRK